MSIESVMPSNHLTLCHPLLFLLSVFPSIRVFSKESALCIWWPHIGALASASVLLMNIQGWFPLGLTVLILQSKGLSRVFSNAAVQKHQFFDTQPFLWSNSHIYTWLLKKPQLWLDGLSVYCLSNIWTPHHTVRLTLKIILKCFPYPFKVLHPAPPWYWLCTEREMEALIMVLGGSSFWVGSFHRGGAQVMLSGKNMVLGVWGGDVYLQISFHCHFSELRSPTPAQGIGCCCCYCFFF